MNLRWLKAVFAALASALALSCAGAPAPVAPPLLDPGVWEGAPVVRTRYGLVQGFAEEASTWVWKAIPFAQAPVGELRWRAPREPEPWAGIRAAQEFNPGCTQYRPVVGGVQGSEDCLALNVWRPRSAERGLPVLVWIHGGGNSIGSAVMVNEYRGSRTAAASNLVFVSLNYRLGPFGWFSLPALREGASSEEDSGNFGTLDLIQGLRWVQENIEAFGGDPHRVTIAGESAGALNVLSLLVSPLSRGLFHRAVVQSAPAGTRDPAEGEERARRVLWRLLVRDRKAATLEEAAGLAAGMSPREIRSYLRAKSDREILRCYDTTTFGMIDNPAVFRDGHVIPFEGLEALAWSPSSAGVPLLIGSNREELKLFISGKSDLEAAAARYGSQRWKATGVDALARRLSAREDGGPVWAYEFAWGAPDAAGRSPLPCRWGRKLGAFHTLEIPFFFGHDTVNMVMHLVLFTESNRPGREALSSAMAAYLGSFVRGGNPNPPGSPLPRWEPWSNEPGGPKSLVLDADRRAARIGMTREELTEEGVFESIGRELPAELAARTREYLLRSGFAWGPR